MRRESLKARLVRQSGLADFAIPQTAQADGYLSTLQPQPAPQASFAADLLFMPHPVYDAPSRAVEGCGQYSILPTSEVPLWCRRFMVGVSSFAAIRGGEKAVVYLASWEAVRNYLHPRNLTLPASSTGEVSQNETNLNAECPVVGSGLGHCDDGALAVGTASQHP